MIDSLGKMGLEPYPTTTEQYAAQITDDLAKWKKLVSQIGIKIE